MNKSLEPSKLAEILAIARELSPKPVADEFANDCYRWQRSYFQQGYLQPSKLTNLPSINDLLGLSEEIEALHNNLNAFAAGKPANHVLLSGPRGCGKTTLAKTVIAEFFPKGVKMVLLAKEHLMDLTTIAELAREHHKKVVGLVDELSFTADGDNHLQAKRALDEIAFSSDNLLLCATSNRRHLVAENMEENTAAQLSSTGELHPAETTEEKISLADRFGLWLPVFAPDLQEYKELVRHWLVKFKLKHDAKTIQAGVQWARERGSFNGRLARQFAVHCQTLPHR